ncbi:MAG: hypothetical protein IJX57_01605 [Clostridia bacterium]|nr:hypothetical protein [Clostridia bacterium]
MKSYIKGIITGFLISAAVFAIPFVAENIDALFNDVRINVNGVDEIQWGENIELDNGETTPSSILYNGTTYLPMRKLGELIGNKIYWNGDSRTVSMTGSQKDIEVIAEKPDKNGNVWTYYTFEDEDGYNYLGVKDKARGYERVYKVSSNVYSNDDAFYFFEYSELAHGYLETGAFIKLMFDSDEDAQDGEEVFRTYPTDLSRFCGGYIIDDEYLYVMDHTAGNGAHTRIKVENYKTGEAEIFHAPIWQNTIVDSVKNNENEIIIEYTVTDGIHKAFFEVVFDKTTNTFGEEIKKGEV